MRTAHEITAYLLIGVNALAGVVCLVAYRWPKLRGRWLWGLVIVAEGLVFIQATLGTILARRENTQLGDLHALVREVCEHPLHREELAPAFAPVLALRDPQARVIGCQALERLRARSGASLLYPLLAGGPTEVVRAARAAMVTITGVEWRGTLPAMQQRLAARGFRPDPSAKHPFAGAKRP